MAVQKKRRAKGRQNLCRPQGGTGYHWEKAVGKPSALSGGRARYRKTLAGNAVYNGRIDIFSISATSLPTNGVIVENDFICGHLPSASVPNGDGGRHESQGQRGFHVGVLLSVNQQISDPLHAAGDSEAGEEGQAVQDGG